MLAVYAVLCVLLLAGQPTAAPGHANPSAQSAQATVRLTHGPLLGAVTDTSVTVWGRTERSARLAVEVKPANQCWPGQVYGAAGLDAAHDFTGVVTVGDLVPGAAYAYRVLVNGHSLEGGTFRTLPPVGQPGAFRFALGGDVDEHFAPFTILDRVREQQPSFTMLLGDLVYSDSPTAIPPTVDAYRAKYRTNWADPSFRRLTADIPSFVMWDDHEIINDYDGGDAERYHAARMALEEYSTAGNPPPRTEGALHYAFQVADVDFYVLDTRTYRDRNSLADGGGKTMLGAEQKADLKRWLAESRAPFKFVLSSVPFHDVRPGRPDDWTAFAAERAELLDYVRQQRISGVVILSGDQHWASLVHFAPYGVWEFNATPLAQHVRPQGPLSDPRLAFSYQESTVFGMVDVDTRRPTPQIVVSVLDTDGHVRASRAITVETPPPPRR